MRFVVSRGGTPVSSFLGFKIPADTPGFTHEKIFPLGFRFEVTDPQHIQWVKQGLFTVVDDGSQKASFEIAKIDAEVRKETERLKQMEAAKKAADAAAKRTQKDWWERPTGIVILAVTATILAFIVTNMIFPHLFHSTKP